MLTISLNLGLLMAEACIFISIYVDLTDVTYQNAFNPNQKTPDRTAGAAYSMAARI
jgi:hypothetical protein